VCKPEAITLDVNIVASKEYYWKVVVKDDKGGNHWSNLEV
jgi:hypothetical protein